MIHVIARLHNQMTFIVWHATSPWWTKSLTEVIFCSGKQYITSNEPNKGYVCA